MFLKLEGCSPGRSSKHRTAWFLIRSLEAKRRLQHTSIIVESTSGNLGVALALICGERGYRFIAVVDPKTTSENITAMQQFGAEISMVGEADEHGSYLPARIERVSRLCRSSDSYVWLDQYSNPANPLAHYKTTGPEILAQMDARVDAVFVAVSTGGTLAGIARYFRQERAQSTIVAVDAVGSVALGGPPGQRLLTGIGSSRRSSFLQSSDYDRIEYVGDAEAFWYCRALFERAKLKVGGSSGAVLAACARYLRAHPEVERPVCVCPDDGSNYDATIFDDGWLRANGVRVSERPGAADDIAAVPPSPV